jgi:protocatechuate 3,4-dioxygenase beta subunit
MQDKIVDHVLGVLNRWEIKAINKHLSQCTGCKKYADLLKTEKHSLLQFGHRLDMEMNARRAKVVGELQQLSGRKTRLLPTWRVVMGTRIVRFAAAAVVIVAVLIGAKMLVGPDQKRVGEIANQQNSPREELGKEIQEETKLSRDDELGAKQAAKELEAELEDVERMFVARDVAGLVDTLAKGRRETKIAAANYLAKIGDLSTIDALGKLAEEWQGDATDNPFAAAISEILTRLDGTGQQTRPTDKADGRTASAPAKVTTAAQQKTVTFKGVVTNKAGDPVPGTTIRSDVSYYRPSRFVKGDAYASTDMAGSFQIGPLAEIDKKKASRTLTFDHPDYAIGWFAPNVGASRDVDSNSVAITLLEPSFVIGRVVTGSGSPVEGATVQATLKVTIDGDYYYYYLGETNDLAATTDADGFFIFERIPSIARLGIEARRLGYANYSTKHDFPGESHPIRAGREDLVITLKPGVSINGRLVYDGAAHKKAGVAIYARGTDDHLRAETDENGRFEMPGLAEGIYTFNVDDVYLREAGLSCAPLANFQARLDQPTPYVEFILQEGLPVTVQVTDENTGEPVREIWIRAALPGYERTFAASGQTDDNGKCVIKLTEGNYVLWAEGWKNGQPRQFSRDLSVKADSDQLNVEIEIQSRPTIWGTLVDANESPVRGTVTLGTESAESDERGEFAMPEPWGASEDIQIGCASDVDRKLGSGFFWKQSDGINDLEVALLPLASVAGRIVDKDGHGVGDARPKIGIVMEHGTFRYSSRNPWETRIEADGRFRFENVPVGLPMKLDVEKPGYYGRADLSALKPGGTLELGDIVLKPKRGFEDGKTDWTGTLSGRVVNERGEPMPGLRVWADGADGPSQDRTDTKGRFRLDKLPRGKRVSGAVYADGYGHTSFKRLIDIDVSEFEIRIYPQGWDLLDKQAPGLLVEKWLNTEPVTFEQYRGKVVLLQIGILLPNYPRHFERIENALGKYGAKGLKVIAIHEPLSRTWAGRVTERDIRAFIEKNKIEFPFGIDNSIHDASARSAYGLKVTPALYLIDKKGIVRVSPKQDDLEKWIKRLLAE